MNQELRNFSNELDWKWPPQPFKVSLYLVALIPTLTTYLALTFTSNSATIYGLGKLLMIWFAWPWIKEFFTLKNWRLIKLKPLFYTTTSLSIPPLLFLAFHSHFNLSTTAISKHIENHQLSEILFPLILCLCIINAALEETFFRGYLADKTSSLSKTKQRWFQACLFMPHHFIITVSYFTVPFALLFTLGTGVAGWVWTLAKHRGLNQPGLWISHFILDLIVIFASALTFKLI